MDIQSRQSDWREYRRIRAWELKKAGWKQKDIAEALGVSAGAVSQWMKRAEEGGKEALYHRPPPGFPPRLSSQQRQELADLLLQGAQSHGFGEDVWTHARVAAVIKTQFGVQYSSRQAGRILRQLGFTPQKPAQQASQRDEEKIAHWQQETWPETQKKSIEKDTP